MPSKELKIVKPKGKYAGPRKAKILFERQRKYEQAQSVHYQNVNFWKYGSEYSFITLHMAIKQAMEYFEKQYGDVLSHKHAMLILHIKYVMTLRGLDTFTSKDLINAGTDIEFHLSFYYMKTNRMGNLLGDLVEMHFLNRVGARIYVPTTRIRMFCRRFDDNAQKLFKGEL
jgi:hypothetical protein